MNGSVVQICLEIVLTSVAHVTTGGHADVCGLDGCLKSCCRAGPTPPQRSHGHGELPLTDVSTGDLTLPLTSCYMAEWRPSRGPGLTNSATIQAQNQEYELAHPNIHLIYDLL